MTDTIDNEATTEEQPVLALVGVDDGPDDADATTPADGDGAETVSEVNQDAETLPGGIQTPAEATEPQTDASGPDSPANVKVGPRMSAADEGHLFELRDKLRERQEREAEAAEWHKAAKKRTEAAQDSLNEYIDELQTGQGNLFRGPRAAVKPDATATVKDSLTPGTEPEAWRDEHITVLKDHGVKDRALRALAEKVPPIDTLGQLSDYMGGQWSKLTDIAGIGNVAAENIEGALTAWFIGNPDKCPAVKSEAAQPAELACAGKLEWTTPQVDDGRVIHHAMPQPGTDYTIEEKGGLYVLDDGFSCTDFATLGEAKAHAEELERERKAEESRLRDADVEEPDHDDTDGDEVDDYDAESDDESTDESDDDA